MSFDVPVGHKKVLADELLSALDDLVATFPVMPALLKIRQGPATKIYGVTTAEIRSKLEELMQQYAIMDVSVEFATPALMALNAYHCPPHT